MYHLLQRIEKAYVYFFSDINHLISMLGDKIFFREDVQIIALVVQLNSYPFIELHI